MLETAKERVKLLKTGVSGKEIEGLYIKQNNFKITRTPILYEVKEFAIADSILDNKVYFKNSQLTRAFKQQIVSHAFDIDTNASY